MTFSASLMGETKHSSTRLQWKKSKCNFFFCLKFTFFSFLAAVGLCVDNSTRDLQCSRVRLNDLNDPKTDASADQQLLKVQAVASGLNLHSLYYLCLTASVYYIYIKNNNNNNKWLVFSFENQGKHVLLFTGDLIFGLSAVNTRGRTFTHLKTWWVSLFVMTFHWHYWKLLNVKKMCEGELIRRRISESDCMCTRLLNLVISAGLQNAHRTSAWLSDSYYFMQVI